MRDEKQDSILNSSKMLDTNLINKLKPIIENYKLNDTIQIVLSQEMLGGYKWQMEPNELVHIAKIKDSSYKAADGVLYEYAKIYKLVCKDTGQTTLQFHKKRSFEPDSLMLKNYYTKTIKIN